MTTFDKTAGPILSVSGFSGGFGVGAEHRQVLREVCFDLYRGRLMAIVGESGSGKSLTALSLLQIQPRDFVATSGAITFEGVDLLTCTERDWRDIRGSRISMVFQDARAALNPLIKVGTQIADVVRRHQRLSRGEARERAVEALRAVRIPEPERRARQFPHEFSGGMAQRVMIAMALVCEPQLLILDEPTTGLDVTIQADIMELISDLRGSRGLSTLLITHDLGVVLELADDVAVMRDGRIVETAGTEQIFIAPQADYTRELVAASQLVRGRDE